MATKEANNRILMCFNNNCCHGRRSFEEEQQDCEWCGSGRGLKTGGDLKVVRFANGKRWDSKSECIVKSM